MALFGAVVGLAVALEVGDIQPPGPVDLKGLDVVHLRGKLDVLLAPEPGLPLPHALLAPVADGLQLPEAQGPPGRRAVEGHLGRVAVLVLACMSLPLHRWQALRAPVTDGVVVGRRRPAFGTEFQQHGTHLRTKQKA